MMKRFTVPVLVIALAFMASCTPKTANLNIPSEYKSGISVNYFLNLWSETEDGSDWAGNVIFSSSDPEFGAISGYLAKLKTSPTQNSGNFTPDFRFISKDSAKNGYDFVFSHENELILRDPNGKCLRVEIPEGTYFDLKEYIEGIRLPYTSPPLVGAYSADRELTEEDRAVFEEAMKDVKGTAYEPALVATQVVAGLNYRFTVTAAPDEPNAAPYTAYVYVFKPLGDGAPELVDIVNEGS